MTNSGSEMSALRSMRLGGGRSLAKIAVPSVATVMISVKITFTELFGITTLGTAVFTSDLPPPSLTDLSAEISEPLFVIYSDRGQGGETISRQYYDAAKGPKELWVAPGGHTGAIDAAPREYERRVVAFFDDNLLEGR